MPPATGEDSRAGTITHEMSHFTIIGGPRDHAYGTVRCKALARRSAALALTSAANFELWAGGAAEKGSPGPLVRPGASGRALPEPARAARFARGWFRPARQAPVGGEGGAVRRLVDPLGGTSPRARTGR
jgi:hypothetical protein